MKHRADICGWSVRPAGSALERSLLNLLGACSPLWGTATSQGQAGLCCTSQPWPPFFLGSGLSLSSPCCDTLPAVFPASSSGLGWAPQPLSSTNPLWSPAPSLCSSQDLFSSPSHFLMDLPDLLQPLPGAPKPISFEERPHVSSLSVTPSHAPCSLALSQSIEQRAKPLRKLSWMKKSLAI